MYQPTDTSDLWSGYETFRPLSQSTEPSDSCLSLRSHQTPVSSDGTFRSLSQHSVRPFSQSTEPFRLMPRLQNLQTPVSVYGTFKPLPQSTKPSDPWPLSQSTKPSDPCLSLRNLQTPVSVYETFRPLSQFTEPSDPCLSLRNFQTSVSAYGTFRSLCKSAESLDLLLSFLNLQIPVSVYGIFRPLSQPTLLSDPVSVCGTIQSPLTVYVIFRPLSEFTEPSDPCLSLRYFQTPVSSNGTFRPLSQSKKPSDPMFHAVKIHPLLLLFLLFTQVMSLVILPVPSLAMRKSRSLIFILLPMDHHTRFVDRVFQISQINKARNSLFLGICTVWKVWIRGYKKHFKQRRTDRSFEHSCIPLKCQFLISQYTVHHGDENVSSDSGGTNETLPLMYKLPNEP